jgi:hypothetical protein
VPSYLTFAEYKSASLVKDALIALVPQAKVEVWLGQQSALIRDRLTKRYAVDFNDPGPVPATITKWLGWLVDYHVVDWTGGNPEGGELDLRKRLWDQAEAEIKEAAESEKGLIELPLRNTDPLGVSAINKGGPLVASNNTIYGFFDDQQAARDAGGW